MQKYKKGEESNAKIYNYTLEVDKKNTETEQITASLEVDWNNDKENKSTKTITLKPNESFQNKTDGLQRNRHNSSYRTIKKGKIKCPFCIEKNIFTDTAALTEHCKNDHSHNVFFCQWCKMKLDGDIMTSLKHVLKNHRNKLRTRYGKPNERVPCPICGIKVGNLTLQVHMNIKHLYPMKNKCNKCEKTFTTHTQMTKHKSEVHGVGVKIKKFLCNICGKKFTSNSDLKFHIRAVHENQRPHVCDECGKAFKRLTVLNKHQSVHTGEKPYLCKICNKTFTRSNGARIHCKNVHGYQFTSRLDSPFLDESFPIKIIKQVHNTMFIQKEELRET